MSQRVARPTKRGRALRTSTTRRQLTEKRAHAAERHSAARGRHGARKKCDAATNRVTEKRDTLPQQHTPRRPTRAAPREHDEGRVREGTYGGEGDDGDRDPGVAPNLRTRVSDVSERSVLHRQHKARRRCGRRRSRRRATRARAART